MKTKSTGLEICPKFVAGMAQLIYELIIADEAKFKCLQIGMVDHDALTDWHMSFIEGMAVQLVVANKAKGKLPRTKKAMMEILIPLTEKDLDELDIHIAKAVLKIAANNKILVV